MKKQLLAITILILLTIPTSALLAGCTSSGPGDERFVLNYLSGICGFTVRVNISVVTTLSDVYEEGDLYYRNYQVDTTVQNIYTGKTVATKAITDPRIQDWVLYNDEVAPWEGTYFQVMGQDTTPRSECTIVETGESETSGVYDIVKPGKYITVFGHQFSFEDAMMSAVEQVASYIRLKFTDQNNGNLLWDIKLPMMGVIPRWDYTGNKYTKWYEMDIYIPIGGKFAEKIPDAIRLDSFVTHQSFKAGYTQRTYTLDGPSWQAWLISIGVGAAVGFVCGGGVPGVVAGIGAGLVMYFGTAWGSTPYVTVALEPRPHGLQKIDADADHTVNGFGKSFDVAKY
jgi:hypothetical protein